MPARHHRNAPKPRLYVPKPADVLSRLRGMRGELTLLVGRIDDAIGQIAGVVEDGKQPKRSSDGSRSQD